MSGSTTASDRCGRIGSLTQLFGFVQLDFAGTLDVPDGRYLARDEDGAQRVLVVESLGAPPPPGRRRRRPKEVDPRAAAGGLPLGRATAVRAQAPFGGAGDAEAWLAEAVGADEAVDGLIAEAVKLLNRALHARTVAGADPRGTEVDAERAVTARIGYGSGEEVAAGRFTAARAVDARATTGSARAARERDLRPQERLAAILGGRERPDACETLLLRARADLDAGRPREAALQLRVGLEALLGELAGVLADPGHEEDMAEIESRRSEAGEAANEAIRGELGPERERQVTELTELCERVIRRRRILRG